MARLFGIAVRAFALAIAVITPLLAQEISAMDETASQSVIRDQISAFQAAEHERAFSYADPTIRNIFRTTDNFIGMVKQGYEPLYNPETYAFGRNRLQNGDIYQEVLVTDATGKQWQAVYTLRQQPDGTWKIAGVQMEPFQGAST